MRPGVSWPLILRVEDKGSLCKSSNTTIQSKLVAQIRDRYAVNTDGRPHQRRYLGGPIIVLGFLLGGSREGGIWLLRRVASGVFHFD